LSRALYQFVIVGDPERYLVFVIVAFEELADISHSALVIFESPLEIAR